MPRRKRTDTYHHGDLRQALLDAAIGVLEKRGVPDFSLREVARAAGVSTGAPYHHFTDRSHLLAALAESTFADLVTALRGIEKQPTVHLQLRATVAAYLEFARKNPVRYRVMYLSELADQKTFASMHLTAWQGMEHLVTLIASGVNESPAQVLARAASVWASCHGFASMTEVIAQRPELPSTKMLEAVFSEQVATGALRGSTT